MHVHKVSHCFGSIMIAKHARKQQRVREAARYFTGGHCQTVRANLSQPGLATGYECVHRRVGMQIARPLALGCFFWDACHATGTTHRPISGYMNAKHTESEEPDSSRLPEVGGGQQASRRHYLVVQGLPLRLLPVGCVIWNVCHACWNCAS
jgi:hypothetical protein